jgi:hypothetical protein
MPGRTLGSLPRRLRRRTFAVPGAIVLMSGLVAWPGMVWSQGAPTAPSVQPPPVVQAAPARGSENPPDPILQQRLEDRLAPNRPGFVDEIGKFFQNNPLKLPSFMSPQQTLEDFNTRAKDAGDNLSRLSNRKVVAGRAKCPVAANGAPDCKSAANKLCTEKGFKEGQSLDSDSAESCSASVLLSGKNADTRDCHVENFVIRAICQ